MRKVLAFVVMLSVSMFLVGCGDKKPEKKDGGKPVTEKKDETKKEEKK